MSYGPVPVGAELRLQRREADCVPSRTRAVQVARAGCIFVASSGAEVARLGRGGARRMDLDFDDPDDAVLVMAAVVDDDDERPADGDELPGAPDSAGVPGASATAGVPGPDRQGCGGCGCVGCLLPTLVIVAAAAAGFGALQLAAVIGLVALLVAVMDRRAGG